ncbi:MAG TPA: RagB/SusD family nutrient uptake outer membrane protein [Pseudosphingobacterium sp.]|nr:RagB/SusD family nutrient uptake outer membrane protein [Pseudosphingobacterium sp.]
MKGIKKISCSVIAVCTLFIGCEKYLDVKPDQSLSTPNSVADLQALLDYEDRLTYNYPCAGDLAATYYYLNDADWRTRDEEARKTYLWEKSADNYLDWSYGYQNIFLANVVIENVSKATLGSLTENHRNQVNGAGHFFRGWSFFHLAQIFAPPYNLKGSNVNEMGIPLRLTADIDAPTVRASLEETYQQVLHDLKIATFYLDANSSTPTRPNKKTAYAAISKTYLVMGDYKQALLYADSCLGLYSTLINYNTLDVNKALPFELFNPEVLFQSSIRADAGNLDPSRARVDSVLYDSYDNDDLRKSIFFRKNTDGSYSFKGSYYGVNSGALFSGIAVDEVLLIKAECLARLDRKEDALEGLNTLLKSRWKTDRFEPYSASTAGEVLGIILAERHKELAFRGGIFWSDRRRLNQEAQFSTNLRRRMEGGDYTIEPNSLLYTFLIPVSVIQESGISQNPR